MVADGGLRLATISPVTTVGEIGVITGLPRSATVEVTKPTTILCIQKKRLDAILRGHRDLKAKLYENVIAMLSDKLVRDNVRLRDFLSARTQFEDDVLDQKTKLTAALELLAEHGIDHEQAEVAIAARLRSDAATILVVEDELATRTVLTRGLSAYSSCRRATALSPGATRRADPGLGDHRHSHAGDGRLCPPERVAQAYPGNSRHRHIGLRGHEDHDGARL